MAAGAPAALSLAELARIRRLVLGLALGAQCQAGVAWADVAASLARVVADDERARDQLALLRAEHAALLAAARAAVAAQRAGHADPLAFVRGVLAGRGQLPADGVAPAQLLAIPVVTGVRS